MHSFKLERQKCDNTSGGWLNVMISLHCGCDDTSSESDETIQ